MKHRYDAETNARAIAEDTRRFFGAVRRLVTRATKGALWQVIGHLVDGVEESFDAELFSGVGFLARPRKSSRAEAIVVTIGDSRHSVIIATRDEDLRRLWKDELDAGVDVTAMFNSATIILIKPDGTVEIRSRGGEAKELALKSDLAALRDAIVEWVPAPNDGGLALKDKLLELFAGPPVWPAGTTILKAE